MRYIGTISKYFHFPYEGMYSKSDIEYIEKTVTGNGYVDLLTAKSGSLSNLTLFGGTVQDDTDVIQSVVLDGATVQRNVPEGYTELDYIKNVMNSTKFNTGLSPQNGDVLELVRTAGSPTVSNYMFQSREGTQAGIYGISGSSSGGTIMGNRGSGQSIQSDILRTNGHKYYTRMSIVGTTLTLTVKDLTDKTENTKTREIEDTVGGPSKYFLRGNATQAQAIGTAQNVYFASITTNGVERIRLIPAKQGDTVGFYDMVSKTFMTTFVGDTPIASTAEATAHPYAPMNIVGNNGAIKVHKNLADKTKLEKGDISSATGEVNSGIKYRVVSDFIPILNGQTYTMSGTIYKINDDTPIIPSGIFALYDSSKNYISGTRTVTTNTFTIDNASASYIRVERYPSGTDEVDLEKSELQFQVGANATAYEEGIGAYIEGQTETVQDAKGNTATADFLMGLSSYKDTQEVLTGNITKNTTYLVLDGTEGRYLNGDTPFFRLGNAIPNGVGVSSDTLKCTHLVYSGIGGTNENQGIRVYSNALFVRYDNIAPATADGLVAFKKFLSDQYAQGTPMIVACGLSTATTKTVEGQELITKPVTQTAGSISNMTITVTSDGGIPSPTTPKDIIGNNGVLKCSKNLLNRENLEGSYLLTDEGQRGSSNNNRFLTNFIKVKPNTNYIFDFVSGGESVYRRICGYSTNDYSSFTELLVKKQRPVTENVRYSEAFTTSATTNYIKISSYKADTNVQLIEGTEAIPYRSYLGIYTEGDIETVKDSSNRTATAEMLLKIGDYVDSQEVLSGAVARNVGAIALDGTESFQEYEGVYGRYRYTLSVTGINTVSSIAYSSHFIGGKTLPELNSDTTITQAVSVYQSKLRFYTATYETLSDFTTFLAQQYANGTPVIVVYPLATETTETVTGQNLNVKSGTNKIEIVQASIDNLGMSATYLSRE